MSRRKAKVPAITRSEDWWTPYVYQWLRAHVVHQEGTRVASDLGVCSSASGIPASWLLARIQWARRPSRNPYSACGTPSAGQRTVKFSPFA
jgi:hypothetical protein